ncbi:hypothetical protein MHU86_24144 [Fragilaria crotonensis]|nr:hypothetical protein MHU86_24144 [Fragilaria crotonensis]
MKFQSGGTGSVILKLCRLVVFASAVSCSIAIFKLELITLQVHTTILKSTNVSIPKNYESFWSEQFEFDEHERGGSIHEFELALTASYHGFESAGKQVYTDEIEGPTIVTVHESAVLADGMQTDDPNPDLSARPETIRFVLFLCDLSFFNGAVALLASLAESKSATSLPPLVMVMEDVPIQPVEQEILEALGAQVKVVDQPQELADAIKVRGSKVKQRWRGVFSKMHLFRRGVVECDLVFYIDVDAVVRGNVMECMNDIIQLFQSKPELDILASGKRKYFNNGVMLARPRDSTFSYLVEMLRNGTCVGDCTDSDYTTMMRRRINTDQDVFIEYTERFPSRFEPIDEDAYLNLRPMHYPNDTHATCSVIHYAGGPKPWEAWFSLPNISIPVDDSRLPMLPDYFPESLKALKKRRKKRGKPWALREWSLEVWRDYWNRAVTLLQVDREFKSVLTTSYNGSEIAGEQVQTNKIERSAIAITLGRAHDAEAILLDDAKPDVTARRETTRFVLFLCDSSFFNGAVTLLASLAESSSATSLPPLVMVMEDVPIKPFEQEILVALGAQVKVVDQPQELADAIQLRGSKVKQRWRGVFSKMHLFRRDVVDCDVVFYIDVDAVVRGNVMECMNDIIQLFQSKPELDILASGKRKYFNNGVMLARPRDSTFSYLVEMLRNGTCVGDCTDSDYTTMMRRRIITDQDVFIEYTQRFPNRFEPIDEDYPLNVRPMHHRADIHATCSVIHYAGGPKPWEAWFSIPNITIPLDGSSLPMLPEYFPESLKALKKQRKKRGKPWALRDWSLEIWRDYWNRAVIRLQDHSEILSPPLDVLFEER